MAMGDCRGEGGGLEGLLSVMKVWGGECGGSEDLLEMEDSRGEGGESESLLVVRGDWRGGGGGSKGSLVVTED